MHDTAERVRLVQLRADELHRKRENRLLGGLVSLCAVLSFFLIGTVDTMTGGGRGNVPGLYGTMLLYDEAGGYVLVGVISFMVAVVITLMCVRGEKKNEKSKDTFVGEGQNNHEK